MSGGAASSACSVPDALSSERASDVLAWRCHLFTRHLHRLDVVWQKGKVKALVDNNDLIRVGQPSVRLGREDIERRRQR